MNQVQNILVSGLLVGIEQIGKSPKPIRFLEPEKKMTDLSFIPVGYPHPIVGQTYLFHPTGGKPGDPILVKVIGKTKGFYTTEGIKVQKRRDVSKKRLSLAKGISNV